MELEPKVPGAMLFKPSQKHTFLWWLMCSNSLAAMCTSVGVHFTHCLRSCAHRLLPTCHRHLVFQEKGFAKLVQLKKCGTLAW